MIVSHLILLWMMLIFVHDRTGCVEYLCVGILQKMTDQIINEWMSEWKNLDADKASTFGDNILANEDLFQAITHVLDESDRFRPV